MAYRSLEKAKEAIEKIVAANKDADIEAMSLDLASLESVRTFAKVFEAKYKRLDILLNNAGIMMPPYGTTKDGFEQQFGVNHLGHFALTGLIFDLIKATPHARIVNISSNAHKFGSIHFDNLMFDGAKGYSPMKAYAQSKLANLLFTYELQRKFDNSGLDIKVLSTHPGAAPTNLIRYMQNKLYFKLFGNLFMKMVQSVYDGSLPGVRASFDAQAKGGTYYGPSGRRQMKGKPAVVQSNEKSHNI